MTEISVDDAEERGPRKSERDRPGLIGRIALFWRQVIAELKKVVTPSREETIRYVWVVLGFVLVVMVIVFVLDFVLGLGADWVFGD